MQPDYSQPPVTSVGGNNNQFIDPRHLVRCSGDFALADAYMSQSSEASPYSWGGNLGPQNPAHHAWSETTPGADHVLSGFGSPKPWDPYSEDGSKVKTFHENGMDIPDMSVILEFLNSVEIPSLPRTAIGGPKGLNPKVLDGDVVDGPSPSLSTPGGRNRRGRDGTTAGSYIPLDQRRKPGGIRKRSTLPSRSTQESEKGTIFHCTFGCGMRTKSASNWKRHEKTQHLMSSVWICALHGAADSRTGECLYCKKCHNATHQKLSPDTPFSFAIHKDLDSPVGTDSIGEPLDPYFAMDQKCQGNGYASVFQWTMGLRKGPQGMSKATLEPLSADKGSRSTVARTGGQGIDSAVNFQGRCPSETLHQIPQFDELGCHPERRRRFYTPATYSGYGEILHCVDLENEEISSPQFPHSSRPPDDFCPGYACSQKPQEARTFLRKDGLVQHLDRVHHVTNWAPLYASWEQVLGEPTPSRCGFCGAKFTEWKERQTHVGEEFRKRKGITMENWKGGLGFSEEWMERVQGVNFSKLSED